MTRATHAIALVAMPLAALVLPGAGGSTADPAGRRCIVSNGRVAIPAGVVLLGEDGEGRPGRRVSVPAFAIDRHEVTNSQFAAFVAATGYRTQAEREGRSAVFVPQIASVPLDNASRWWRFVDGADWRHPQGPGSSIDGHDDYPVVHVTREDGDAYARWAGGTLPSEEQWERAARGAQEHGASPASWAFNAHEEPRANVWEGVFPVKDTGEDGFAGIAPVGCFEANDFGLHDMIGNVWEWTAGTGTGGLIKGGSYLCSMDYCANFRPAGFQAQERDLGTTHIGIRVAYVIN